MIVEREVILKKKKLAKEMFGTEDKLYKIYCEQLKRINKMIKQEKERGKND
jgi:hypothetical protein